MTKLAWAVLTTAFLVGCSGEDKSEPVTQPPEQSHAEGPHGGHLLEVGAHVAHLEVLHDEAAGKMTIYVLGPDETTALQVEKPPELKLSTETGPKVLVTIPQDAAGGRSSTFTVTDEALRGHGSPGRISIEIDGKVYNPDIEHHHGH